MNEKTCTINQPAGIGDVFFTQAVSDEWISKGYDIVWPLVPQYAWAVDHIEKKNVTFCSTEDDFEMKDVYGDHRWIESENRNNIYIPLSYADRYITDLGVMDAKLVFCNVTCEDWRNHITLLRNEDRENDLIKHLNINGEDDFTFLNRNYGTPPGMQKRQGMHVGGKVVEMEVIDGFNIFDWIGIMMKAKEIHTIGTSICYLIDYFEDIIKPEKLVIYNRPEDSGFEHLKNVHLRKDWEYTIV